MTTALRGPTAVSWLLFCLCSCMDYGVNNPREELSPPDEEPSAPLTCAPDAPDAIAALPDESCIETSVLPPTSFEPTIEWTWSENAEMPGYDQVMMTPVVGHLNDDNGDGRVGTGDVPDVIFSAFEGSSYWGYGSVVALSGDDGSLLWTYGGLSGEEPRGSSGIAVAAPNADGEPLVVFFSYAGLTALDGAGVLQWHADVESPDSGYGYPAFGDLEGDGTAEIIVGASAVDAEGNVLWTGTGGTGSLRYTSFPIDLDGDGTLEVVAGNTIYDHQGAIELQVDEEDGFCAVGDLDGDGTPEVVVTLWTGNNYAYALDGSIIWRMDLKDTGGGPPTIADFDGDGEPEVGVASEAFYWVVEGDGTILWGMPVSDYSSRSTGSSVFDFEGDGAAEVVYADEHSLWVFDGATGEVELEWTDHSSGTLFEYPLIVDVDADGATEIVVASNNYHHKSTNGITVLGNASNDWRGTRPIWNQHAFFTTNIHDDGTVPAVMEPPWLAHNTFRANEGTGLPIETLHRADLTIADIALCDAECPLTGMVQVWVAVANQGLVISAPSRLDLVDSEGVALQGSDLDPIAPGASEWLGPFWIAADEWATAEGPGFELHLDEEVQDTECVLDNHTAAAPTPSCEG